MGELAWHEGINQLGNGRPECVLRSCSALAKECFQLGEDLLDRFVMLPLDNGFLMRCSVWQTSVLSSDVA